MDRFTVKWGGRERERERERETGGKAKQEVERSMVNGKWMTPLLICLVICLFLSHSLTPRCFPQHRSHTTAGKLLVLPKILPSSPHLTCIIHYQDTKAHLLISHDDCSRAAPGDSNAAVAWQGVCVHGILHTAISHKHVSDKERVLLFGECCTLKQTLLPVLKQNVPESHISMSQAHRDILTRS